MLKALARTPMTSLAAIKFFRDGGLTDYSLSTLERRVPPFLRTLTALGLATESGGVYSRSTLGGTMTKAKAKTVLPGAPKGNLKKSRRRVVDIFRRKAIETAAIKRTEKHYMSQGYDVRSREAENIGWDLEVTDKLLSEPICVEVKGTSVAPHAFKVELTPNEYTAMKNNKENYRVCVVSNALGTSHLHEFFYEAANDRWIDADTAQILVVEDAISARLSV
jgi:hypothetical protein